MEVPNFGSVRAQRDGPAWPFLDPKYNIGQFTPTSLASALVSAGFDRVTTETVPFAIYRRAFRAVLSYAKQADVLRGWPAGSRPTKHELLRAVARAPGGVARRHR